MREACPKCGCLEVDGAECPGCGVIVSRYRDYLAVMSAESETGGSRLGLSTGPAAAGGPAATARPAGFWLRAAAVLIDWGFVLAVKVALGLLVALLWGRGLQGSRVFQAAGAAFPWLFPPIYCVLFHWFFGQTMGKMMLGIRVVMLAGGPLTLGVAVRRALGWALSLLLLGMGHVLAGLRADRRALHDLLAGTRVERL